MEEKELRNIIVKHTSIMLDNPDKYGIYPTGKFYNNLEKEIITFIEQQLQAYKDREDKIRYYLAEEDIFKPNMDSHRIEDDYIKCNKELLQILNKEE